MNPSINLAAALVAFVCVSGSGCSGDDTNADNTDSGSSGALETTTGSSGGASGTAADESTGTPPTEVALEVFCEGEGSPAIVFEAGLSRTAEDFIYLASLLDVDTTVCRYTRRGLGTSTPLGEDTRTSAQWRDDLVSWMDEYGITDPAVFVAHSAGGVTIRMLRDSHPDRVAGVVMLDTSQAQLLAHDLAILPPDELPAVEDHAAGNNTEQWDILTSFAALEAIDEDFGDVPMSVLVGSEFPTVDFLTPEENEARYDVWIQAQMDVAALSTASAYMLVEGGSHSLHLTDAEVVAVEIERVFMAAL